jgi:hypothetical protein
MKTRSGMAKIYFAASFKQLSTLTRVLKIDFDYFFHIMRFTAFLETRLNPGIRDVVDVGHCRWVEPTHHVAITDPLTYTRHVSRAWV